MASTEVDNPRYQDPRFEAGKRYRASVVTKILGDLNYESTAKSTYVVGFLTFKEKLDTEKVIATLKERLFEIPRFRSKYVYGRRAYFESLSEDQMDYDYHFRIALKDEKPTFDEVAEYVSANIKKNYLDKDKPLWQFTLFPELDDGRGVVVTNISHVIGDGVSQTEVLFRLLDDDVFNSKITSRPKGKRDKQVVPFLTRSRIFIGGVFNGIFAVFGRPDPQNSLKLKSTSGVSEDKRLVFTEKIPLSRCKEIKSKIHGSTLNDVFMVHLTMVLRRYYDETGEKPRKISASFPINLRKSAKQNFDKYGSPHNIWAYGMMKFNLNYTDEIDLFKRLKKTLDKVKLSPSPVVQQKIGAMISPILPLKVKNKLVLNLANKCTAQLSNVPGPSSQVSVAGHAVDDLTFQLFSPVGLYLGLITYNGTLSCSINADASVADPKELAKHWMPAFEDLHAAITSHEEMIYL